MRKEETGFRGSQGLGMSCFCPAETTENSLLSERILFEEAKSVFYDKNARLIHDPDHSTEEERYILLGLSEKFRLLTACHCYREDERVIRIISARKAGKKEKREYTEAL